MRLLPLLLATNSTQGCPAKTSFHANIPVEISVLLPGWPKRTIDGTSKEFAFRDSSKQELAYRHISRQMNSVESRADCPPEVLTEYHKEPKGSFIP